ncbi:TonB-dependent siderophore receptor [Aquipseudomonas campi]
MSGNTSHPKTLRQAVRLALSGALLVTPVAVSLTALPAWAQTAEAGYTFAIPAGSLESAIVEFSSVAGVTVSFEPAAAQGRRTSGLQGTFTVGEALQHLLQGTGLQAVRQSGNSYSLLPAVAQEGALELGATSISGKVLGQTTEGTGSYTTGVSSTATKMPLSLRQTPQSTTVITRQLMDDQNLSTINQVLTFTPGITSNHRDSERYSFSARGFGISNFQYDGIPAQIANDAQQYLGALSDMAIYDRVEVVRGATGLLSGTGNPSAAVNLVRKRPTLEFQGHVAGELGSWDKYRSEVDVSGPLTDSGNVRGRFVTAYEKKNSFIDWYKQENRVMYGALDIDLSDDTTLRTSLDYQNNNSDGTTYGHIPLYYSNGQQTNFSRSFNPATRWSYMDNTAYNFTTMLEQRLANDWMLKTAYTHQYAYRKTQSASASGGYADQLTGVGNIAFVSRLDSYQTQDTLDTYASGPFSLGGRDHDVVVGVSSSRTHLNFPEYSDLGPVGDNPLVGNIHEWDGRSIVRPEFTKVGDDVTKLHQSGIYGSVRLKPTDDLAIILGTRVSWWDINDMKSAGGKRVEKVKKSGVVTPYLGIVYDLNETYSVYASYTNIFQPQTFYKTASGGAVDPLTGDNYEIGLKGEFFDGALNASVALFEVKQKNEAAEVGVDASGKTVYKTIAGTRTRGIETEVSGEVLPGLNVFGGYTYRESHDKDGGRVSTTQPMSLFKLGTSYRLPGKLDHLTIGGNVIWQSDVYAARQINWTGPERKATQDSYALLGLFANYEVDEHLSVGLKLNNLTDQKYYDGIGTFSSGSYGEPRNAAVNAKWRF